MLRKSPSPGSCSSRGRSLPEQLERAREAAQHLEQSVTDALVWPMAR